LRNRVAWGLAWWALAVLGAHALAFAVLQLLPGPALSALGLAATGLEARNAFLEQHAVRPYLTVLSDLAQGRLGTTLDGLPVADELGRALAAGLPRLGLAAALIALVVLLVGFAPRRWLAAVASWGEAIAFLPPFVAPFLGVGVLLLVPPQDWAVLSWMLSAIAIAAPAAALGAAQAARITLRHLEEPFALTMRAMGASARVQRARLIRNLVAEMAPTLEKVVLGLFSAALFAEAVFGQNGIGALAMRAIRRSDTDLTLAVVLVLATVTGALRLATTVLRERAGYAPP
jgi:ABC-type dipeptide/oligopeptide/nickel transport system permease component